MYAVIATGGKQYRVEKNGTSCAWRSSMPSRAHTVDSTKSCWLADGDDIKIGAPLLKGGKVTATVEKHGQGDKVVIVKFRRRKHYLRQGTHRQQYTQVKITGISA